MKFDLIISNPPYNRNLDLKILESVIDFSEKICFVHPVIWLYNNKGNNKFYEKLKLKIGKSLSSIEIINSSETFGIAMVNDCSINLFDKSATGMNIDEIDYHGQSSIYKSIKNKVLSLSSNSNVHTHAKSLTDKNFIHGHSFEVGFNNMRGNSKADLYTTIQLTDESKHIGSCTEYPIKFGFNVHDNALCLAEKSFNHEYPFEVGFNFMRGHWPSDLYTTIQLTDESKHYGVTTEYPIKFGFNTQEEMLNFKDYLKLKFTRFCLSIFKINRNVHQGELKSVPWLDFSKSWSDEECAKELGITDEELLWMINWIPDYYPEDAEIYRKLEEKLASRIYK